MPNYTENYGLKKPLPNENYNVQDHNDNMDIIDTELKKVNDKVDSIEIPVTSVNGKVGDVELTAADIGAETPAGAQAKAEAAAAAAVAAHEEDPDPHEQYALEADLAALQEEVNTHKAECAVLLPKVGSTANDILLDIVLTDKKKGSFRAATNNTGNMTLNGKPFKKDASTQIPSGGVKAGKVYDFYYDQDSDCVFILAKASGNAQPSDVLAGKTFSNDDGEQEGTMPNRAGDNAALAKSRSGTTLKLRAPKGFYDGTDDNVTYNEPNWIAENIPSGISMFGLAGTNTNKKWASGILPSGTLPSTSAQNRSVSGIGFSPDIIIYWDNSGSPYSSPGVGAYKKDLSLISEGLYRNQIIVSSISNNVKAWIGFTTSDGFEFTIQGTSGSTYNAIGWIAFKL